MSKHFLLTSKSVAIPFIIVYFITRVLYLLAPITTSYLIHCVEIRDYHHFILMAIFYVCLFAITQIMDYFTDITEENCYADSYVNLVKLLSRKISNRDYRTTNLSLEQVNQMIGQDFEKANKYFFVEIVRLVYYIFSILFILTILFNKSWKISLVILVLLIVFIPINLKCGNKLDEKSEESLNKMSELKSILNDQYQTSKEDRFLNEKQMNEQIYTNSINDFVIKFQKKNKAQSFYLNIISYGTLNLLIMVMIIMASFYVLKGEITFSTLYLFNSYTSQLWNPGEFIFEFRAKYNENKPIFQKIKELESIPEFKTNNGTINTITFENYIGTGKYDEELHVPLNITFNKDHIYLIKGDNGVGKTTFIENLLCLTNRYKGFILYNQQNSFINDFTYVPSKPYISKYHNITISKGSDGQKKFYQIEKDLKNTKTVIILDEPTNYLDANKKNKFIQLLQKYKKDHIVILISHDPVFENMNLDVVKIIRNKKSTYSAKRDEEIF